MTPSHTTKKGKRYRYYVTHSAQKRSHEQCSVRMIRAGEIEGIVFDQLKAVFRQPQLIVETWRCLSQNTPTLSEHVVRQNLIAIENLWDHLFHNEQARLLQLFIRRIDLTPEGVSIQIRTNGIDDLVHSIKQLNKQNKRAA